MSLCPVLPSKKSQPVTTGVIFHRPNPPRSSPRQILVLVSAGSRPAFCCRVASCRVWKNTLPRGFLRTWTNVCELLFFHGSLHCPENQKRDLFLRRSGRRSCQQSQQEGSKVTVTASYAELVRALILQPLGPRHFRQQGPHGEPHTAGLMHCEIISTPLCDAGLNRFLQVRVSRGHLGPNSLYSPPLGQTVPPSYRV